jgi:hypothetical protein
MASGIKSYPQLSPDRSARFSVFSRVCVDGDQPWSKKKQPKGLLFAGLLST